MFVDHTQDLLFDVLRPKSFFRAGPFIRVSGPGHVGRGTHLEGHCEQPKAFLSVRFLPAGCGLGCARMVESDLYNLGPELFFW